MKNIDTAFQHIRLFCIVVIVASIVLDGWVVTQSSLLAGRAQQRIYILANDKVLQAYASDHRDNIAVEARDHVKMFHYYFFTLDPDEKVIAGHIGQALYLADESAKRQYDNLKESGYFNGLIAGNISQHLEADSIVVDTRVYPYHFRFVGREQIIRASSILTRKLVTEGELREVSRSDNNPHGFLLERWRIVENRNLSVEPR